MERKHEGAIRFESVEDPEIHHTRFEPMTDAEIAEHAERMARRLGCKVRVTITRWHGVFGG